MQYHIVYNDQPVGPMPKEQLRNYGLTSESLVWAEGMDGWVPAGKVPDLADVLNPVQIFKEEPTSVQSPFASAPQGKQRQVSFGEAVSMGFSNYANFDGRSSRSEYWWWWLFTVILNIVAMGFTAATNSSAIESIISLAILIPSIAVSVRRLHDIGKSGWWYLIVFTCIGAFVLLYWYLQPSEEQENEYGPVPNVEEY